MLLDVFKVLFCNRVSPAAFVFLKEFGFLFFNYGTIPAEVVSSLFCFFVCLFALFLNQYI